MYFMIPNGSAECEKEIVCEVRLKGYILPDFSIETKSKDTFQDPCWIAAFAVPILVHSTKTANFEFQMGTFFNDSCIS